MNLKMIIYQNAATEADGHGESEGVAGEFNCSDVTHESHADNRHSESAESAEDGWSCHNPELLLLFPYLTPQR